jgi:hypothetical protein
MEAPAAVGLAEVNPQVRRLRQPLARIRLSPPLHRPRRHPRGRLAQRRKVARRRKDSGSVRALRQRAAAVATEWQPLALELPAEVVPQMLAAAGAGLAAADAAGSIRT